MIPDLDTLRVVPWLPGTALVTADLTWLDESPVNPDPRQVLKRQIARLAEKGLTPYVGTELEFIVFEDSYRDAWKKKYDGLYPASDYNIDYALMASSRMEPLLRDIRNGMDGAGMYCEGVKGECNLGQQEIAFKYTDALATCDNHSIYKNGAKEIADQHGKSLTFMAKFNEREGNSCHIHLSVVGEGGEPVMADKNGKYGFSKLMEHWIAGQLKTLRELTLFFAPNINSYKRYVEGSFAPTAVAWGLDNRTCALRVVGHGRSLRVENRVPGGDVNQYLAVAALIAGGIYGIENELELEPIFEGNAYVSDAPRVPSSLREATALFAESAIARAAFGDDVVDHYLNNAMIEQKAYDAAITDWERVRGFERF
jgi:glutamine synthetase